MLHSLFLAFAEPAAGHASDAHATHAEVLDPMNWLPGVTALVVFLIAFGVLAFKVWPTITKALDERDRKIRDEIESAESAREQAKAALAEYERSLATAREEAGRMINQAKADAKAAADEMRARNQAELVEMKQRATREIESAKQAAINEIYNEASQLGVAIAGKILQREVSARDQERLIDDSLRELTNAGR
jgi:F-type H+-transporting ATPase subunit b